MARVALIILFGAAVFLGVLVAMNPDYFFPNSAEKKNSNTQKNEKGPSPTPSGPADCPTCPLPSN